MILGWIIFGLQFLGTLNLYLFCIYIAYLFVFILGDEGSKYGQAYGAEGFVVGLNGLIVDICSYLVHFKAQARKIGNIHSDKIPYISYIFSKESCCYISGN